MMNDLLDKGLGTQYPEELGGTIDLQSAMANTCKFNRWGSLVAVGTTDGKIFICDFLTQKPVKIIQAHVQPISNLSWSRDGRKILSCGGDNFVKVWDVLEGTEAQLPLRYSQSAVMATFNPRNDNQCVVLPNNMPPVVENFNPKLSKVLVCDVSGMNMTDDGIYAVSYDRRGKYIIAGSSKGKLIIFDSRTLKFVTYVKQPNSQQIRQIYAPKRGNLILTNTQDRVIRVYRLEDMLESPKGGQVEPHNKVLDIVNKAAWKSVCTDMEANYICGASMKAHQLYIWERTTGTLMKILTGTKGEAILDCQWHPTRPVILSISSGQISVWTQAFIENWSAFAPDFTELEENLKYQEKEGEFDDEDEDADEDITTVAVEDDDIEVDVMSYKPHELCCSSDEEDVESLIPDHTLQKGPLWFLPQTEIESPDQAALVNRDPGPMPRLQQASIKDSLASMIGLKPRRSK